MSHDRYARYLARLDPEIRSVVEGFLDQYPRGYDLSSPEKIRAVRGRRAARLGAVDTRPPVPTVTIESRRIPGLPGGPSVRVRIYRPEPHTDATPAMLWAHGGGFVMGEPEAEDITCSLMADRTGIVVVSVDYRLAPEHPYPAALNDCHAGLLWLQAQRQNVGIDSRAILVGGASAGGGLMASLCRRVRDLEQRPPLMQVLSAPALDSTSVAQLSDERLEAPPFNRNLLFNAWHFYLGPHNRSRDRCAYADAASANDVSGLPPAHITVAALDPLLDENLGYSRRLVDAGVDVELHVYPGACHGFEIMAPTAGVSQRCLDQRHSAVRAALEPYR